MIDYELFPIVQGIISWRAKSGILVFMTALNMIIHALQLVDEVAIGVVTAHRNLNLV